MRRPAALLALAVGLASAAVAASPASASPAAATAAGPGGYVPVGATRVLDTRTGAYGNHRGAVRAGRNVAVVVTGSDGVPSSAAAVAVSISVVSATGRGVITASTYGVSRRPGVATVSFAAGQAVGDLAVVPVKDGRITLWNASSGTVQLTADVSGYYVGGSVSGGGAFRAVTPTRVVDTRTGAGGNHKGALRAGAGISPRITGRAGVPVGAAAVAATITTFGNRTAGTLSAYTFGGDGLGNPIEPIDPGRSSSQFVVLPLSSSGQISIVNHARDAVNVAVDVAGYMTAGPSETPYSTQVVEAGSGQALHQGATIGARRSSRIALRGIPRSGTVAALVLVRVVGAGATGSIRGSSGAVPTVVQFSKGSTRSGVEIAPVSGSAITLSNGAGRATRVQVDVLGYVTSTAVAPATATSTARYLDDLTGSEGHDTVLMGQHGTADAQSGARFVLLDVGAQSITAPLSAAQPGVVPALAPTRVTLTYRELVDDVTSYLDAFEQVTGGASTTVVIGTNSSGAFDPSDPNYYAPQARGTAWADDVVNALRTAAPSGISVIGADDIEAGFGDVDARTGLRNGATEAQALSWENAYLAATSAPLVYNGDAEGCPRTLRVTGRSCTTGWTQAQYYDLASDSGRVEVLPQVFYGYEAAKWADIDQGGSSSAAGGGLRFLGSLTEHAVDPSTYTAEQGRAALYRALSTIQSSPSLPYAVDLQR